MKILELLNKKNFSILIICLIFSFNLQAEDKPVDLWNLQKNESDITEENIISNNKDASTTDSINEMQTNIEIDPIKLDKEIASKEIKIIGLYDPAEYGLSIDMWSNSDGSKLKMLFENISKYSLSNDASEIMKISM